MLVFLDLNGESIDYDEDELEDLTLSVANGKIKKDSIVSFLVGKKSILNNQNLSL